MDSSDLNKPLLDDSKDDAMETESLISKPDLDESKESSSSPPENSVTSSGHSGGSGKPPISNSNIESTDSSQSAEEWRRIVKTSGSDAMRRVSQQQLLIKPPPPPPLTVGTVVSFPWTFLKNQMRSLREWFNSCYSELKTNHKLVILGLKAGIASTILSIMCVLDDPFDAFSSIGVWAVATADLLFESNIGLSFSKGTNRTAGTLVAGVLALGVNKFGPYMGEFYPYFVVICVFIGGSLPTFFRFRPPFKDRWNYAVVMSQLTFHILILSGYNSSESLILPISRFGMILLGFIVVVLVNLSIKPNFAGNLLHNLVSKNFNTAAKLLERCVEEYRVGTVLDHVPRIWSGMSKKDDKIHNLYHEVVMSDAEVDKLLGAVPFEPSHGKFFYGYPWYRYDFITDFLRYVIYDIIGLDSCLRGEIQAPVTLRTVFENEITVISKHCAETLKLIGQCIQEMKWMDCSKELNKAEEGALRLQHKIGKEIPSLLADNPKTFLLPTIPSGQQLSEISSHSEETPGWNKVRVLRRREFLQKNESMHRQWDATTKRVATLSFMKFSSMLLEIVAKMNFIVEAFDELAMDAKFENAPVRVQVGT